MSTETSLEELHNEALRSVKEKAKAIIRELEPAVKRYNEAEAYLAAQEKPKKTKTTRARRSRVGGTQGDKAVKVLQKQPGISPTDLAKKLGMKNPAYAYTVLRNEIERGTIRKVSRGQYEVINSEPSPEVVSETAQETEEHPVVAA